MLHIGKNVFRLEEVHIQIRPTETGLVHIFSTTFFLQRVQRFVIVSCVTQLSRVDNPWWRVNAGEWSPEMHIALKDMQSRRKAQTLVIFCHSSYFRFIFLSEVANFAMACGKCTKASISHSCKNGKPLKSNICIFYLSDRIRWYRIRGCD